VHTANSAVHTLRLVVVQPGSDALNDGNHIRGLGLATPRRQTTARCATRPTPKRCVTKPCCVQVTAVYWSGPRGGDIGVVDRNTEGVRPIDLLEDERLVGMEGFEDYEQG
jgi:hypothetical protein